MEFSQEFMRLLDMCRTRQLDVCEDSRRVTEGAIFVARPGAGANGADYIADAIQRGAGYVVADLPYPGNSMQNLPCERWVQTGNPRVALNLLAQARFGTEKLPMKIIGITGTNGKTTCAWLLEYLFRSRGEKTALLGTIEYHWPGYRQSAPLTTPGSLELHEMLGKMMQAGVQTVIMEVSSHALDQERVSGIDFSGAIFTNLTQDHLDYHKDLETYFRAKARLFLRQPKTDKAMAINSDDAFGRRLLELVPGALSFGLHKRLPGLKHLWGQIVSSTVNGMMLQMTCGQYRWELTTPLIGAFNAANLLAVQAIALEFGFKPDDFGVLSHFTGVPGRLERIGNPDGYNIFVDYAHTPDALINALRALRGAGFTHIITVFGCGGNRDRDKRPLMGKAVADNSDIAILTSDNPRNEDPLVIMQDVKPGLAKARSVICEENRYRATQKALELATPATAILIAGKGHEDYQIIGATRHHYSDQEVVRELLGC